jgi:glycine cleavage system protein P-like pyridoxal-binding family
MNTNYVRVKLKDHFQVAYPKTFGMHEVLISDGKFTPKEFTTMDVEKGMIDAGYHPQTIYFP